MTTTAELCDSCHQRPRLTDSRSCSHCRCGEVESIYLRNAEHYGWDLWDGKTCPLSPHDRDCRWREGIHHAEHCDMCGRRDVPHYASHWNGAFQQCENCAQLERLDPDQNGRDPLLGGTFAQGMAPVYAAENVR